MIPWAAREPGRPFPSHSRKPALAFVISVVATDLSLGIPWQAAESTISMNDYAPPPSLEPCPSFHRWRHLERLVKIGKGASGEVYRAWDSLLQREVALKLSRGTGDPSDTCSLLALREARLLARIRHPNVVNVYGVDYDCDRLGVWMEYIRGLNLDAVVRQNGPLSPQEVTAIGFDLCSAVGAVHDLGLLHGDITAKNVMRESTGRIVLLDFGFSQDLRALDGQEREFYIGGTPLYMAPELLTGGRSSAQSDIYAIGVLLYRLATGRYPLEARSVAEVRTALNRRKVKLLCATCGGLGRALVTTVNRAIDAEPAARFSSVAEMIRSLRGV